MKGRFFTFEELLCGISFGYSMGLNEAFKSSSADSATLESKEYHFLITKIHAPGIAGR